MNWLFMTKTLGENQGQIMLKLKNNVVFMTKGKAEGHDNMRYDNMRYSLGLKSYGEYNTFFI